MASQLEFAAECRQFIHHLAAAHYPFFFVANLPENVIKIPEKTEKWLSSPKYKNEHKIEIVTKIV